MTDHSVNPQSDFRELFDSQYNEIFNMLNLEKIDVSPKLNLSNAVKLGLDENNLNLENLEDSLVAFIISSEFNS